MKAEKTMLRMLAMVVGIALLAQVAGAAEVALDENRHAYVAYNGSRYLKRYDGSAGRVRRQRLLLAFLGGV